MGKGDKKSRRGKIVLGTSGVRRRKNKKRANIVAPKPVKEPVKKVVAEKPAPEKPKKAEVPVSEKPKVEKSKAEKPKAEGAAKKTKKAEPVEKEKTDE